MGCSRTTILRKTSLNLRGTLRRSVPVHWSGPDNSWPRLDLTAVQGISYLSAPMYFALLLGVPGFCRFATLIGFSLMCGSLILGSFSTNTSHLILSQGIGFGLGAGLNYCTVILWLNQWFVRRRGFAFGFLSVCADQST